jgi:hypothetical protein
MHATPKRPSSGRAARLSSLWLAALCIALASVLWSPRREEPARAAVEELRLAPRGAWDDGEGAPEGLTEVSLPEGPQGRP